jgi:drug/metabolite transporter (DMT)-like permease
MSPRVFNAIPMASLVLAAGCWGLGTVLSKLALAHIPPLTLLVTQLAASLMVLWPLLGLQRVKAPWSRKLLPVSLLGWLNPGISYTLSLIGLSMTTASASALLWATEPLLIVALAWLLLRERLTPKFLLLTAIAAGGASLVIGADFGRPGVLTGNVLILGGVLCCALYTVLAARLGTGISPLLAVTLQESLALGWALLIWPVELSQTGLARLERIPPEAWGLAALSGLVYYGLAFWFYLSGLRPASASEAGQFINLVPVFALAGAYLFLGESLQPIQWLGCGLVLLAVIWLAVRQKLPQAVDAR